MSDVATVSGYPDGRNEDYVAVVDGVAVVLDGVTPPPDGETGCQHTVSWFAQHLGDALVDGACVRRDRSLSDCLAAAIRDTAAVHASTCDLSHRRTPQATVAMVRWDPDRVEYLVLSDAVLLIADRDGVVTPILDRRLDQVLTRPDVIASRRRSRAAHRAILESLRNAEGGFFTAAADPAVAARATTGSVCATDVVAAAVLSDGAARWTEVFRLGDWSDLVTILRSAGASALIDRVRAAEAADPHGTDFPRGKPHDDASVAYVEFSHHSR